MPKKLKGNEIYMAGKDPKAGVEKKYFIITYGCQMNVRDSELIAGILETQGYSAGNNLEKADLIVFNTCSVRHSAENKVYGKLGEVAKLKKQNPELLIAFGGCMAQLENVRKRLKKQRVDIIFGTKNIHELPLLIKQAERTGRPVVQIYENDPDIVEGLPSRLSTNISAFVNVMYGCDNFCSYCIVPYTRGRERSRSPLKVLSEIQNLAERGYKEVTLLGQNVNSYGKGLPDTIDFADLLHMVNKVDGIQRIRFTTSHPRDMSDKLIAAIAEEEKVCEHIHVAMQSGSNRILKLMNRGYTREHYLNRIQKIRDTIPGAAISTDIITGFPGETEQDFFDTLDVVKEARFESAFTFMYSVRSGTKAADMEDQVPFAIRSQRLTELNKVQYAIAAGKNSLLEGTCQEVLVEGPSKTDDNKLSARTRTNHIVIFSGTKDLIGRTINVKITEAKTFSLLGEQIGINLQ